MKVDFSDKDLSLIFRSLHFYRNSKDIRYCSSQVTDLIAKIRDILGYPSNLIND
jgi:hypothetical protein